MARRAPLVYPRSVPVNKSLSHWVTIRQGSVAEAVVNKITAVSEVNLITVLNANIDQVSRTMSERSNRLSAD